MRRSGSLCSIAGLAIGGLLGCATPQSINIKSVPAGAAISIDNEYVGESPAVYPMRDIDDFESLRVSAEMGGYESATKTLTKKPGGLFPGQVFLKLDPNRVQRVEAAAASAQRVASSLRAGPDERFPLPSHFEMKCWLDEAAGEPPWRDR